MRQQVAEDMDGLLQRFGTDPRHQERPTYEMLERDFYEQWRVILEQVTLKGETGGNREQNPSGPEAAYGGHEGQAYQLRVAETARGTARG